MHGELKLYRILFVERYCNFANLDRLYVPQAVHDSFKLCTPIGFFDGTQHVNYQDVLAHYRQLLNAISRRSLAGIQNKQDVTRDGISTLSDQRSPMGVEPWY